MDPLRKSLALIFVVIVILGCFAVGGWALLSYWFSTTPRSGSPALIFPTRSANSDLPTSTSALQTNGTIPSPGDDPQGKIVYVCQLFKLQARDQICIINADGTGQRRLSTQDSVRYFYPSMAPDGKSVFFSSNLYGNFKLYELTLNGELSSLGNTIGIAPEVSPNNLLLTFANNNGQHDQIWVANRDGSNPRMLYNDAWDPTWSPDSSRILYATTIDGKPQLASINLDGSDYRQITDLPDMRGRSDWSEDGKHIVTYSGKPWERELYIMDPDGSNLHQITPAGGNSQGPSFSPDGQWVAFTAYFNAIGNNNGCEIYIMRLDGSRLTRLTNNTFCDWQPRWGP